MKIKAQIEGSDPQWIEWLDAGRVEVNGTEKQIDLVPVSAREVHMVHGGRSYTAELVAFHREEKVIELVLNGKPFRVSLQDKYDELLRSLGMENTGSARAGQVKAPMPGMVLDILVSEGQEVEKDTPLVILEAMKMENVIKSPAAGKVKSIPAVKSKPVEKNSILIEFH